MPTIRETTLIQASEKGDKKLVEDCLDDNAIDISATNEYGRTALHLACFRGHIDIIKLLVEAGAKLNVQTCEGYTPLHQAVYNINDINSVKFLLDRGADYSITGYEGRGTPLQIAKERKNTIAAEIISDFISKRKYAITLAADKIPKIETAVNQISQLEKEIQELKQITLQNYHLPKQNTSRNLRFFGDLLSLSHLSSAHLIAAAVGLTVVYYEGELFKPHKLASLAVLILIIAALFQRTFNTMGQEYLALKARFEKTQNQISDLLVEGIAVVKTARTTFQSIGATSMTFSNAIESLKETTNEVLLEFKQQSTGLVYELKGAGKQVAEAFQLGIESGKFKPEANVSVDVNAHIEANLEANFLKFKL